MASNSWKRILNSLFGTHKQSRNSQRCLKARSFKLHLEALEDRLVPSASLTTLGSFDGITPNGGLVADGNGNLYGTTANIQTINGTQTPTGTVFEIVKGSNTITTLATITGATPNGGLVVDNSGNVFGTTSNGGASGKGSVFEVANGSGTATTLASFSGTSSITGSIVGSNPTNLVMDHNNGNIFGTTNAGGSSSSNNGTVFELTLSNGNYTATSLATFPFTKLSGANPIGNLVLDTSDNVFGTATNGGGSSQGDVFEYQQSTSSLQVVASFGSNNGVSTGLKPLAGLIVDSNGNFYGTTTGGGGANNTGTVFELAKNSSKITPLASFGSGITPTGSLAYDPSSGILFGVTSNGGTNGGTIYALTQGSNTFSSVYSFNGVTPIGGLIEDSLANFYGVTTNGGTNGGGTVFELTRGTATVLVSDAGGIYNGNPFPATATVNGGASLDGVTPTLSYYVGTYSSAAQLSGLTPLSGNALTFPGNYTVLASFAGSPNYNSASAVANFTISPPTSDVVTRDSQGRVTLIVYTTGNVYQRAYNSDGTSTATLTNTSGTVAPGISSYNYSYSAQNALTSYNAFYTNGNVYNRQYAGDGSSTATLTNGSTTLLSYTYDTQGRLTGLTYANGNVFQRTYKADGTSTATLTNPSGTVAPGISSYDYNYDGQSNITSYSVNYTNGNVFQRTINADGSSTATLSNGGTTLLSYTYDTQGRLTSITYANGNVYQRTYNDNGTSSATLTNSSGTVAPGISSYNYNYDAQGNITSYSVSYANGNVYSRTYASDGSSTATLSNGSTTIQSYIYDTQGRVTSITYANGSVYQRTYNADGSSTATLTASDKTTTIGSYSYNAQDQITQVVLGYNGNVLSYTYTNGVLSKATLNASAANGGALLQTYNYNAQGQISSIDYANGNVMTYKYDASGVLTSTTLADSSNTPLNTYNYNAQGQVTSIDDGSGNLVQTNNYNIQGQVSKIVYANGNTLTYTYTGDGAAATASLTNGSNVLQTITYDVFGRVTKIVYANGNEYDRTYAQNGTSTATLSNNGTVLHTYTYDAQGNLISMT